MPFPGPLTFPSPLLFPGITSGVNSGLLFQPPFVVREVRMEGALRMQLKYGLTVLRIDGAWVETEWPTQQQLEAADLWFPGGTVSTVDEITAAALLAAGYEITELENE